MPTYAVTVTATNAYAGVIEARSAGEAAAFAGSKFDKLADLGMTFKTEVTDIDKLEQSRTELTLASLPAFHKAAEIIRTAKEAFEASLAPAEPEEPTDQNRKAREALAVMRARVDSMLDNAPAEPEPDIPTVTLSAEQAEEYRAAGGIIDNGDFEAPEMARTAEPMGKETE